jgi:hypothetical protein
VLGRQVITRRFHLVARKPRVTGMDDNRHRRPWPPGLTPLLEPSSQRSPVRFE